MKRSAFSMLELIFVIVTLGILAVLAIPRIDRDLRQEAQTNLLSAIRYTQNLALADNKTDPRTTNSFTHSDDWQKTLWQLRFRNVGAQWYYTISSDLNRQGGVDQIETAIDITNGKRMYNGTGDYTIDDDESPNIFLTHKYGINSISLSCDTDGSNQHLAFDHLGRPHANIDSNTTNNYATYLQNDCTLTATFSDTSLAPISINIAAETGYASLN